jgi:hypothetical protein
MNVQCTSKLQRFHLSLIFTLTIAITAPPVFAKTFDATIDILPIRANNQYASSQSIPSEPAHWIAMGTHDSGAVPTPAPPALIAKAKIDRQTQTSTYNVVVDQVVAPYINVGSFTPESLKSFDAMKDWQVSLEIEREPRRTAKMPPLNLQLQELAAEEPIDIESLGPSVLVPKNRPMSVTGIEVAPINPLIGSSPIIATIEEDYMPYDLSADDLKSWNAYSIASHPISAGTGVDEEQTAGLWDEFDTAMALSKTSDPAELNLLAKTKLDPDHLIVKSPYSPSDTMVSNEPASSSDQYQTSRHDTNAIVETPPVSDQEDSAITSDEALAILTSPETPTLAPAPQHSSQTRANPETTQDSDTRKGPTDLALQTVIQKLPELDAIGSIDQVYELSTATSRLIGSYIGGVRGWSSERIANIAAYWPTQDEANGPSRIGAKLLSRASVLDSGVIEEHAIGAYIPIERLDGVDCGSGAAVMVADADSDAKAR